MPNRNLRFSALKGIPFVLAATALMSAPPASAQNYLDGPVGPEGSARSIGMGMAVAAIGVDPGALATNPATLSGMAQHGINDLTAGVGARGTELFAAHVYGEATEPISAAVWAGTLSGPRGRNDFVAFSTAEQDRTGISAGGTLRMERWHSGPSNSDRFNADVGLRYSRPNEANTAAFSAGLSGVNLLHVSPFAGTANVLNTETQIIGAVGYRVFATGAAEFDYVYAAHRSYARAGGEFRLTGPAWVRAGISDRDVTLGATFLRSNQSISLAADFIQHEHPLFLIGFNSAS